MSDSEDGEEGEAESGNLGDPAESQAAFKQYMLAQLIENGMEQKRASKMEILDFLTLLNCLNKAGIHFK
jgi:hypothetical protein